MPSLTLSVEVCSLAPVGVCKMLNLMSLSLLGESRVSDLGPLSGLTNLMSLSLLGESRVSDLGPLSGLTNLTSLSLALRRAFIVSELRPRAGLTS